jgi:hypothetical protein
LADPGTGLALAIVANGDSAAGFRINLTRPARLAGEGAQRFMELLWSFAGDFAIPNDWIWNDGSLSRTRFRPIFLPTHDYL